MRRLPTSITKKTNSTWNRTVTATRKSQATIPSTFSAVKSIVTTMDVYAQEIPESVKRMVERDEADVLGKSTAARPAARVLKGASP